MVSARRNVLEIAQDLEAINTHYSGKIEGKYVTLRCMVHGGNNYNLKLWPDDEHPGRIAAVCHSQGCSYKDIAQAIQRDTGISIGGATDTDSSKDNASDDMDDVSLEPPANVSPAAKRAREMSERIRKAQETNSANRRDGRQAVRAANKVIRRAKSDRWIDAIYHTEDGQEAISYRISYPEDAVNGECPHGRDSKYIESCTRTDVHKHIWRGQGGPTKDVLLLIWEPEEVNQGWEDTIVIAEGEKAARSLKDRGYISASYLGGSGVVGKANFSPVKGWNVIVWPDADNVGRKAGDECIRMSYAAGAESVSIIHTEGEDGKDAADYSDDEVHQIMESAVMQDAVPAPDIMYGVNRLPEHNEIHIEPNAEGMATILDFLKLEIRFNVRCYRMEIRRTDWPSDDARKWTERWRQSTQPGGWIQFLDGIEAAIYNVSMKYFQFEDVSGRYKPAKWADRDLKYALENMYIGKYVDPFVEWLDTIAEWDGEERIHRLWIETLAMPDNELVQEAGKRFIIGAVRRAIEPGCNHDWIPVLVGEQGLGKSSILRELVSVSPEWFSDGTQLDGTPKERMETTGPAVISEFAEMSGLTKSDAASFKNYISQRSDQLRPAYGRHTVRNDRRWVGVGTANDSSDGVIPRDNTGARRYVIMQSEYSGDMDGLMAHADEARKWVRSNRDQLWAEALHYYCEAVSDGLQESVNRIPGHLRSKQEEYSKGMAVYNEGMVNIAESNDLQTYARAFQKGCTIAELMVRAELSEDEGSALKDRSTQRIFGSELTAAGWSKFKRRVEGALSYRWLPPTPKDEDLEDAPEDDVEDGAGVTCSECGSEMDEPTEDGMCNACYNKQQYVGRRG